MRFRKRGSLWVHTDDLFYVEIFEFGVEPVKFSLNVFVGNDEAAAVDAPDFDTLKAAKQAAPRYTARALRARIHLLRQESRDAARRAREYSELLRDL